VLHHAGEVVAVATCDGMGDLVCARREERGEDAQLDLICNSQIGDPPPPPQLVGASMRNPAKVERIRIKSLG